jgi:hypothetical protein
MDSGERSDFGPLIDRNSRPLEIYPFFNENCTIDWKSDTDSAGESSRVPDKIRFREGRFNAKNQYVTSDISEKEPSRPTPVQIAKKKSADIIWTRNLHQDDTYQGAVVKIYGIELQGLIRVKFVGNPQLHIFSRTYNSITFASLFKPIVHK